MTSDIKVSVIIPTYNRSHSICRAIDSVFSQTHRPFEIIVVDDGSTDDTKFKLTRYEDKIRYIYQENSGNPGKARNKGLDSIKGNWIAFLDSDDVWYTDKLEMQLNLIERSGVDLGLVFCDYFISKEGNTFHAPANIVEKDLDYLKLFIYKEGIIFNKDPFHHYLILKNPIHTSTVLMNKELLSLSGGFDPSLTIAEDRDLWISCAEKMAIGYVPKALCKYNLKNDNITKNKILYYNSLNYVMEKHLNKINDEIPRSTKYDIMIKIRNQHRALSLENAKIGNRGDAINELWISLKNPDLSIIFYLSKILMALISPRLYLKFKKYYRNN